MQNGTINVEKVGGIESSSKGEVSFKRKVIEKLKLKVSQTKVHSHDRRTERFRSRRGRQRTRKDSLTQEGRDEKQ